MWYSLLYLYGDNVCVQDDEKSRLQGIRHIQSDKNSPAFLSFCGSVVAFSGRPYGAPLWIIPCCKPAKEERKCP